VSDYSGDSQRRAMIERETQERDWATRQYISKLEEEVESLKLKLKVYEEGDQHD